MERKILFLVIALLLISGCSKSVKTGTFTSGIELKEPTPYERYSAYGTLADIQKNGNFTTIKLNYESFNCEKNSSAISVTGILSAKKEPVVGEKYHFIFTRNRKEDDLAMGLSDMGLELCRDYHDSDLVVDARQQTRDKGGVSELLQTNLNPNAQTQVSAGLINRQDTGMEYRISDIVVFDEIKKAAVAACKIEQPMEGGIDAGDNKTITFTITCNEPIDCIKTYESCDINGQNCRTITLPECQFHISSNLSFTDEFGFEHTKYALIKQEVRIK